MTDIKERDASARNTKKEAAKKPDPETEELVRGMMEWVDVETPSSDPDAVNNLVDLVESQFAQTGAEIERISGKEAGYGDILIARSRPLKEGEKQILVLGHLDTVHPHGSIKKNTYGPNDNDPNMVHGPGTYDMKGGAYLAYHAFKKLMVQGGKSELPITIMLVPDEEVSSPFSRKYIAREAKKSALGLVMEGARDNGEVVSARKGVGNYQISVKGIPAHAGNHHKEGANAIVEMAQQIKKLAALTDYDRGITVNVGTVKGGSTRNTVAEKCSIEVNVRVTRPEDAVEIDKKIKSLTTNDPRTDIKIRGGMMRPPMPKTEATTKLLDQMKRIGRLSGHEVKDVPMVGGGSDANLVAAEGVPVIDGLGPKGHDDHTAREYILKDSMKPRADFMLNLYKRLKDPALSRDFDAAAKKDKKKAKTPSRRPGKAPQMSL